MKTIKSSVLGSRLITDNNAEVTLSQLKEIIKEHRAVIINRIMNDIPVYLDYKFSARLHKDVIFTIKEQLLKLRNEGVNLESYDSVVNLVLNKQVVHLNAEPFYTEIDGLLAPFMATKELKFAAQ